MCIRDSFIVGPLFIRGQYLEETEKFSGVFLFFIGDCLLYTSRCV